LHLLVVFDATRESAQRLLEVGQRRRDARLRCGAFFGLGRQLALEPVELIRHPALLGVNAIGFEVRLLGVDRALGPFCAPTARQHRRPQGGRNQKRTRSTQRNHPL